MHQTSHVHSRQTISSGYCKRCKTRHSLGSAKAIAGYHRLMAELDSEEATKDYLFGPARGKMFGVMECMQPDGSLITLRAFSGQYNGLWEVEGWVPPLFNVEDFFRISDKVEKQIKAIGREIEMLAPHSEPWLQLRKKRRQLSQALMRDIHNIYQLKNFHGATATLSQAYNNNNGIPTGTGDCCAPKLLNYAANHQLTPLGIAEFYWGRENRSASRQHGSLYSSCREKCEPILGFMLCGLNY
ncbi:MAG: hypothetical protein JRJ68_11445 [Deltaproteobacteria bacterium]|nr:hypothetical protein [Deltaproteobacteria bacterium]